MLNMAAPLLSTRECEGVTESIWSASELRSSVTVAALTPEVHGAQASDPPAGGGRYWCWVWAQGCLGAAEYSPCTSGHRTASPVLRARLTQGGTVLAFLGQPGLGRGDTLSTFLPLPTPFCRRSDSPCLRGGWVLGREVVADL